VPDFHVAQVNVALARAPLDSPVMAEFVAALDDVNALADSSPGFVWRLQTEDGDATAIRAFDDERMIINMSVWESIDDLAAFVYRSGHVAVMRQRRRWFETIKLYLALWWVQAGRVPTVEHAKERLDHLRVHGPTPNAFTFKRRFAPSGETELTVPEPISCPA
jgi:hypothetical protein